MEKQKGREVSAGTGQDGTEETEKEQILIRIVDRSVHAGRVGGR